MFHVTGPLAVVPRLASSVALAALMTATLLASPVSAQSPAPAKPPAAAAATSNKPESVEQRIVSLHEAMKVTADQEAKWVPVATAMRENAAAMEKLVATKRGQTPESLTAVEDLNTYQEFAQAQVDGLKKLTAAFKTFYDSMPAEQKKNADVVFQKYGTPNTPAKG